MVFVLDDVSDYQSLLAGLAPNTEVHVLDASSDALAQMAELLRGRSGIDALHVISHGREGAVSLGTLELDNDNLESRAEDLATIGSALNAEADILLYGCEVGAGTEGERFIQALADATGADVAGSTNVTGASTLGGDWSLERASAAIDVYNPLSAASLHRYAGILVDNTNTAPSFAGANTPLALTTNALATDISSLLRVIDTDSGQTLTWTHTSSPPNGILVFSPTTQSSGSATITPGGTLTYQPNTGFAGIDTFTIQVNDGIASTTRTITVNVAPSKPGAPDLSNSYTVDTGVSQNDNITNASTLSFGGTSATGDSSSTVRVFVDTNNNGVYDAGDISGTTTVNNGAWTVSGIDVSSIEGGFNVYSQVTSSTGNLTSVRSDALNVTLDRTAPTLAITSNRTTLKAGETATITFTFSEDPGATFTWSGNAGDVTVTGGTLGTLSGSGLTRTATFTPTADVNVGTASISVATGAYTDAAGNNGGAGTTPLLTFDTLAPSVTSITRVGAETSNAATIQYTVTFDSSVSGVDLTDFQVNGTNGATGTVAGVTGSGTTYTVTVNNISGDGTLRLDLKNTGTGIIDSAGNAAPGYTAGETYNIDRVAPTVTSVGAPMAGIYRTGQPLEFTVNFDEAVTVDSTNGTPSIALTLDTGGTVQAEYKSGSGTNALVFSYTVMVGNADANGVTLSGSIVLNNGAIRDLAGNNIALTLNNLASTSDVLVDALAASVTSIERVGDEYTNATTVQFTVTFSDDVTGVDTGDFTLVENGASGTIGGIEGDGDTYVITIINVSGDGTLRLDLKPSGTGIEDSHGQATLGGYTNGEVYHVDRTPPTLTTDITISRDKFNIGAQATVTFTFSEAVKGFTENDVTVPNGTLTDLRSVDGITWTATLIPDDDAVDATNVLTLDMTGLTDQTGNASVGTRQSANYEVDTVRPHLVGGISISDDVLRIGDSATVTFVFNEAVTGVDLDNLQADNGMLTNLVTENNITWTATLTPAANTTAAGNAITLNYTGILDAAGNGGGTPVDSASYVVDTVRPALALPIGFSDANLTNDETATVTFTFTEKVTGFTIASVTVPNGTLSDMESEDGITWTATLTPKTGVVDTSNYLTVDFSTITDVAGNPGVGTVPSGNYTIDTTAPALAKPIEISDTALKIGDEATVTFTFNGPVVDFTEADINVPNGNLTQLWSADGGTIWTAILAPKSDASDATNVFTLNYAGIRSESGTAGTGSAESPNYAVDTVRPTLVGNIEISDTILAAGQEATVTFTFNEAVTGFSEADVTVPNGTLSDLESLDGGITWTATLTPASRTVDATNVLTLDYTGISDLAGNAGAGSVHSDNYAVDTTQPLNPPVTPPTTPPVLDTIDGVPVIRETLPIDPATGVAGAVISVPIVTPARPDNPATPNVNLADIPLGLGSGNGPHTELLVSLPVGIGMRAEGPSSLLTNHQALLDLIRRIEDQTQAGSSAQAGMTGNGASFLEMLAPEALVQSQTLLFSAAPGLSAPQPILISGSSTSPSGGGQNPTAIGLVIDTTALPFGSTLQLNNVDFAVIIGAATVFGGDGRNYVTGDGASQTIILGADDDVLYGGGGDDMIGSQGGNDRLFGDAGNDLLFGGEGNDYLDGGTGTDTVRFVGAGRSDYTFRVDQGALVVTHRNGGIDGTDTLLNVEHLTFTGAAQVDTVTGAIARLYSALLHRAPDESGAQHWAKLAEQGMSIEHIARQLLQSAEGTALWSQPDTAQFIESLYQQALGRTVDPEGRSHWTQLLDQGTLDHAGVVAAVTSSAEGRAHPTVQSTMDFNRSDIATLVRMYDTLLDRKPDEQGLNFWIGASESGMALTEIGTRWLQSAEAQARFSAMDDTQFVAYLYRTGLERSASDSEVQGWASQLGNGTLGRSEAVLRFADSEEKIALMGVINTSIETI